MLVEPLSKIWVNYQNKPNLTNQYIIKAAMKAAFNAVPGTGLEPQKAVFDSYKMLMNSEFYNLGS